MKTLLILLLTLFSWIGMQAQAVLSIRERQQTIPAGTQWLRQAKMAAVNSCDTWTFQQQLSSAAGERPTDVVQLPGNQYIVGGSDSAGTTVRARLIKLSAEGTVLQSKAYALPGKEVTVERLRLFSDGKLYVLANAWDPSVRQIMPLLFSVDTATLSLLSVLKFENTTWSPVWQGVDFGEGRGLQAYVLVSNSYLLNVTRIDLASNSMRWSQTYQTQLFSYPVGIGVEYGDVYIAWNEMDYGRSKGMIMSLHPETGTLQYGTSTGGGADGVDIELQSISMVNLRPRFTALRRIGYNIQAVRLNYETTATPNFTEVFTLGGFSPEADMQSRQDQWGQTMAFQSAAGANQIHLLHTYPDNRQTPVRSW